MNKISEADLVIVAGTSLKVYPFASLIGLVPKNVPVVVINYENPVNREFEKFLFIQGDIEENCKKILGEI